MFSNMPDIDKGMEVFDVNGEKIGSVDEVYSPLPDGSEGSATAGSGGGAGALGDESRVSQVPGHGGRGALGDESRAGTTPPGGSGALGNESMVGGASEGVPGTAGTESPIDESVSGGVDEILIAEAVVDIPARSEVLGSGIEQQYFKVEQGGILGFGAKALYIPFRAVQNVVAGDRVTVNCTKEECDAQYGTKPDTLQE